MGKILKLQLLSTQGQREISLTLHSQRLIRFPLFLVKLVLAVAALDGRPLGSGQIQFTTEDLSLYNGAFHAETIRLFVFQLPQTPIILGLPWLEKHNPTIPWSDKQIIQWSESCRQCCLDLTFHKESEKMAPLHFLRPQFKPQYKHRLWRICLSLSLGLSSML